MKDDKTGKSDDGKSGNQDEGKDDGSKKSSSSTGAKLKFVGWRSLWGDVR